MADYLHEDIIINILERLPVKTLLSCTAVCKSWYSLITTPQFISSHLKFATPSLLLRRRITNSELYELYSDNNESFNRNSTLEFPFRSVNSFFTVVGSCNGLLCLSDDRVYYMHKIILWNPCIKKSVILPKPELIYNPYGTFVQSLGFGFDPVASDFKVVRITYVDDCFHPHVELYKLSTGIWQDMSYLELECVICNGCRGAYVDGATHWIARCGDLCDLVVLFDMSNEVFGKMMLPVSLVNNYPMRSKDLVVLMDCLALVLWNVSSGVEPNFCVWVMKEYGVEDSWTKHLCFNFQDFGERFFRPVWVRKNGEVVTVCGDGHLISYDPNGAEVKDLGVHGSTSEDCGRSIHVDGFVESLVLLERGPNNISDAVTCNKSPTLQTYVWDSFSSCGSDYEHKSSSDYKLNHGSYSGNRAM